MNAIWTMLGVAVYLGGSLGPSDVMTGRHAVSTVALAIFIYSGFVLIEMIRANMRAGA